MIWKTFAGKMQKRVSFACQIARKTFEVNSYLNAVTCKEEIPQQSAGSAILHGVTNWGNYHLVYQYLNLLPDISAMLIYRVWKWINRSVRLKIEKNILVSYLLKLLTTNLKNNLSGWKWLIEVYSEHCHTSNIVYG